MNVALFGVSWLCAPGIAAFFEEPGVTPVLRAMFALFLIDAIAMPVSLVLERRLEFGRVAVAEIGGSLAQGVIAIGLALLGVGVWSLVLGALGARVLSGAALLGIARWRPRLRFSGSIARQFFAFGKYLWAFAVLSAVGGSVDRAIVGKLLGTASLGAYQLGFNVAMLPSRQITTMVNRISLPALARMQDDRRALAGAIRKSLAQVAAINMPLAFGILAVAHEFVVTAYGDRWLMAVVVIQILGFYGLVRSIAAIHGPVFQTLGKPQVLLYTSIFHHVLFVLLLLTLGRLGIEGICGSVLLPLLVSAGVSFVLIARYLSVSLGYLLAPVGRAGAAALVMYALVELVQAGLGSAFPPAGVLAVSVLIGAVAYLGASATLNRSVLEESLTLVREVIGARGRLV